jgi:chromosome segregation ATPase
MDLSKMRQLFFRNPPQQPDHLLGHAGRELDHREQLIREKQQAVEEQLRSLHEANHRLQEAESLLRRFDETERVLNAKFEDLKIREEQLEADRALLDSQIEEFKQKLADPDSQAAKIVKEEMEIKNERERLLAADEELSGKSLHVEEKERALQSLEDNLKVREEEISRGEKRLREALQEGEIQKRFAEEEVERALRASQENEELRRLLNEKTQQIEIREKEVGLREKSFEDQFVTMEAKRAELVQQGQLIDERLHQIDEQVQKKAIEILKIAHSIARGDSDNNGE